MKFQVCICFCSKSKSFHSTDSFTWIDRRSIWKLTFSVSLKEVSIKPSISQPRYDLITKYIRLVLSYITRIFYRRIYWRLLRCCPEITSPSRCCSWSWCRSCGCNFHWRNQGAYTWLCYIWLIRISFCFAYSSDFYSRGLINNSSRIEIRNLEKKVLF